MVMKAAHAVEAEAIVEAAEMVVVQTMHAQVEGLAAAQEEIVSAVQEMGWGEAVIMEVVQIVIMEAAKAAGQEPDWLREVKMAVLDRAHQIVVNSRQQHQHWSRVRQQHRTRMRQQQRTRTRPAATLEYSEATAQGESEAAALEQSGAAATDTRAE